MTILHIPDDVMKEAGLTERDALIELACRLLETRRLSLFFAAKLAGLSQPEFEDVLLDRQIPVYRYDQDDLAHELKSLRQSKG